MPASAPRARSGSQPKISSCNSAGSERRGEPGESGDGGMYFAATDGPAAGRRAAGGSERSGTAGGAMSGKGADANGRWKGEIECACEGRSERWGDMPSEGDWRKEGVGSGATISSLVSSGGCGASTASTLRVAS